jgi:hypothetical protein
MNIALAQLVTSVDATRKDQEDSGAKESEEDAHPLSQRRRLLLSHIASHVVDKQEAEEEETGDLERQTCHGNVHSVLARTRANCRQSTSGGLENEADNVERDEDPIEELGLDA